ncbi:MAG: MerC domain-containing protein [Saprospirales bacterium]|nr:MerC domain-containing protein [Saprospirales bacterium]
MNIQKKSHSHHTHHTEQLSVFLSIACAIHCMLTPILVILMPMAGLYLEKYPWIEYVIILSVLVLGSSSFYHGYKLHHPKMLPIALFAFGVFYDFSIGFTSIFSSKFYFTSSVNCFWWNILWYCSVSEFTIREKLE